MHNHGHSMSSLHALRDYDPVLLEQPDTITKFIALECRCLTKEVGDRVKFSLNLYRTVLKFCSIECLICCFYDELKMKIG